MKRILPLIVILFAIFAPTARAQYAASEELNVRVMLASDWCEQEEDWSVYWGLIIWATGSPPPPYPVTIRPWVCGVEVPDFCASWPLTLQACDDAGLNTWPWEPDTASDLCSYLVLWWEDQQ